MRKPILYILCGIPGSGKSTWAEQYMREHEEEDIRYVSRDEIRFSLIKNESNYFAHEREVYAKFAGTITQTLVDGFDVIADATHINHFSRRKLTSQIDKIFTDYNIIYVVFYTNVEDCINRNKARKGREKVPDDIIVNMCKNWKSPYLKEDARAIDIIVVTSSEGKEII